MKQFFYLSVFCALALTACTGAFKKGDNGIEYKIISKGSGNTVGYGNFIQLHIKQIYGGTKDTMLMNTWDIMPRIQVLDSVNTPLVYYNLLKQMKKGDSLIIRVLTDSLYNTPDKEMPAFMKKGKYMYTHVSLLNFFETKEQADSAHNAERSAAKPRVFKKQLEEAEAELAKNKAQLDSDDKKIQEYLAKNNIKAEKTKWGTYIAITAEGTGNKLNFNDIASINYTGRTLDSAKVFDSNTDPAFGHVEPFQLGVGEIGSVILGWTDALLQMKKGTRATIYIPSSLAYGENGRDDKIKKNEILVFDMEITDAATEEEFMAKQQEAQKKSLEVENKSTDSPQKK